MNTKEMQELGVIPLPPIEYAGPNGPEIFTFSGYHIKGNPAYLSAEKDIGVTVRPNGVIHEVDKGYLDALAN